MKRFNTFSLAIAIIILSIAMTSCGDYEPEAYNHLNDQKLIAENTSGTETGTGAETTNRTNATETDADPETDLCERKPYCCGRFSDEEVHYKDVQRDAIEASDPGLCTVIPEEPLVIDDCPDTKPYTYYNKSFCLEKSGGQS